MTITVRVLNAARRPLVLEYQRQRAALTDEMRNLYTVPSDAAVHGIGFVRGPVVDSQFTVAPGRTRDFSIDFVPRDAGAHAFGPRFAFSIALTPVSVGTTGRVQFGALATTSVQQLEPGPGIAANAERLIAAVRSARASCGNDFPCLEQMLSAVDVPSTNMADAPRRSDVEASAIPGTKTVARTPVARDTATNAGAGAAAGSVAPGVSIGGIPGAMLGSVRRSATGAAQDVARTAANTTTDLATSSADGASKAAVSKIDDTRAKADSAIARARARAQKLLPKWKRP